MNKAELIERLTERLGTDRKTATAAVEGFVDLVVRSVHKGESVTITGFGVFEKRKRAPRVARNPRTGETVKVKATKVPAFRPGAQFKAIVAGQQELSADGIAVKRGSGAPAVPMPAKSAAPKAETATKPATKKAATKKVAVKKAAESKKPADSKKADAPKKTDDAKKPAGPKKSATVKKAASEKSTAEKSTAKKSTAKKSASKKDSAKKSAAKK